jgi:GLPGLI family protein
MALVISTAIAAQKTISEGMLTYTLEVTGKDGKTANALSGATEVFYVKGGLSRKDINSNLGVEKTIHDAKTGNAVILKEYSGQKLMITLNKQNWTDRNKNTADINFATTDEVKQINGYNCTKATATLKNGSVMLLYYTQELNVINKEYSPLFRNLDGVPVMYELERNNLKFTYTLAKVELGAIPLSKFEFPKTGYRVMTYEENQSAKKEL